MPERIKFSDDAMVGDIDAWIDDLLSSDEARPSAPAALHAQVRRARRRKRWAACGLAATAAAATLAAVLLWPQVKQDERQAHLSTAENQNPLVRKSVPPVRKPVATFVARSDLIAVPIVSGDPTVTIVQIYPTIQAQRRWRRQAAFRAILSATQLKPTTPVRGG